MVEKENVGNSIWQNHDHIFRFWKAQGMNSWCQWDDF
jgi:hypothetical protein